MPTDRQRPDQRFGPAPWYALTAGLVLLAACTAVPLRPAVLNGEPFEGVSLDGEPAYVPTPAEVRLAVRDDTPAAAPLWNGGFEAYQYGWWHPEDQYGGVLDLSVRRGGLYSWRMDLDAYPEATYLSASAAVTAGVDHRLTVWVRAQGMDAPDAVRVRLQQFAGTASLGWLRLQGNADLLTTGGTHGWQALSLSVPANAWAAGTDRVTLYLRGEAGTTGTVWFDDVAFDDATVDDATVDDRAMPPRATDTEASDTEPVPAGPPRRGDLLRQAADDDAPFLASRPPLFRTDNDANLFYGTAPARVTIRPRPEAATITWHATDYDGTVLLRGTHAAQVPYEVVLPGTGYFEVAAQVTYAGGRTEHHRTALAHLPGDGPALPATSPAFPFGSWVQQDDLLDDLGARWSRVGSGWRFMEPEAGVFNEAVWAQLDRQIDHLTQQGITPIFLFHDVPRWAGPGPKLVSPAHWQSLRRFVRAVVARYGDRVDHWEAMNEPYIPELFPGTNADVLRWHRIIREEVDRGDPGGHVLGACLNPRRPHLMQQLEALLGGGLAGYIDGLAIHTYGGLEADGFREDLAALRTLLAAHGAGTMPIYITEHGLSVPEEAAQERLQAEHLARALLLTMELDVEALIWHMQSWPQGPNERERNFAIVRARTGVPQREPRPAFVAAATAAHVLGPARYVRTLSGLDATTGAHLYRADDAPILALWEWGRPERDVTIDVGVPEVTVIDMVGRRRVLPTPGGVLRLTLTPAPVYILGANPRLLF